MPTSVDVSGDTGLEVAMKRRSLLDSLVDLKHGPWDTRTGAVRPRRGILVFIRSSPAKPL